MTRTQFLEADIISGACIDGLAFDVLVSLDELLEYLGRLGPLTIADADIRLRTHPISCELWRVTNGRVMPRGVDQHELVAQWSSSMARFAYVAWGGDAIWGQAATLAAEGGRSASRLLALGPYHELFLAVPNVCVEGDGTRHMAVLGMITDSSIARSIDTWLGYGFDKQPGRFEFRDGGALAVLAADEAVLSGRFHPPESSELQLGAPSVESLNERWTQPLLGGLHDGHLRRSWLRRAVQRGSAHPSVCGEVNISFRHVGGGDSFSKSSSQRVRGMTFSEVEARISRPWALPVGP